VIVDAHSHVVAAAMTSTAGAAERWQVQVAEQAGRLRVWPGGRELTSVVREFIDPQRMAEEARADGVDHLLLSPWVRLLPFDLPVGEADTACRIQNRALAEIVAGEPAVFSALGSLPLQDPGRAARNLPGLLEDGLAGVELSASVAGRFLGDDAFEPFWEAAEETGALLFVHPTTRGLSMPVFDEYYMWNSVANPVETATTAAHLVMAGVLERHPGLRILLAHGGGAIGSIRGRLDHSFHAVPAARSRLTSPPSASIDRFYFDTVTHSGALLSRLLEDAGTERVLLGSDRPFDMGSPDPVAEVRALGLPPEAEAAVLGGNAERLLRRP
jgi:aminocarboxymuconate-semialdehyde decarboxylase